MTNNSKENQQGIQPISILKKHKKHLTSKTAFWFFIVIFGVYLYFDEVLREEIKDIIWALLY
jgi:hypothetical protein